MEKIVVQGGDNRLLGSVTIEGAKNAVLPLLAATVLASEGIFFVFIFPSSSNLILQYTLLLLRNQLDQLLPSLQTR